MLPKHILSGLEKHNLHSLAIHLNTLPFVMDTLLTSMQANLHFQRQAQKAILLYQSHFYKESCAALLYLEVCYTE